MLKPAVLVVVAGAGSIFDPGLVPVVWMIGFWSWIAGFMIGNQNLDGCVANLGRLTGFSQWKWEGLESCFLASLLVLGDWRAAAVGTSSWCRALARSCPAEFRMCPAGTG